MKKVIIAVVLLALAGFAAFAVKDLLDARAPINAVPQLVVTADSQEEPIENRIAAYVWNLALSGELSQNEKPVYELGLAPAQLMGGERLSLDFSRAPDSVAVSMARDSYSFYPVEEEALAVPFEPGAYIYQVYAKFPSGNVLYYFYITV